MTGFDASPVRPILCYGERNADALIGNTLNPSALPEKRAMRLAAPKSASMPRYAARVSVITQRKRIACP